MGDHRLNVKITLMGLENEIAKVDWWVNWEPDRPEYLYKELVKKAILVGLEVDDKRHLFDEY
jgi:hypothetical protein